METLELTINKLEERYNRIKSKNAYLNDRQKTVLEFIKENEPVKIGDITSELVEFTPYTLKKDVKYLVDERLINKFGRARATIYVINEKI